MNLKKIESEQAKVKEYMKENLHRHFPDFVGMLVFGVYGIYLSFYKILIKLNILK